MPLFPPLASALTETSRGCGAELECSLEVNLQSQLDSSVAANTALTQALEEKDRMLAALLAEEKDRYQGPAAAHTPSKQLPRKGMASPQTSAS